jgi:hypothetical protein
VLAPRNIDFESPSESGSQKSCRQGFLRVDKAEDFFNNQADFTTWKIVHQT